MMNGSTATCAGGGPLWKHDPEPERGAFSAKWKPAFPRDKRRKRVCAHLLTGAPAKMKRSSEPPHQPQPGLNEAGKPSKNLRFFFADCTGRIPCYTACSRLPALVRRSEHKETAAMTDFKYSLSNLKPRRNPARSPSFFPGRRQNANSPKNTTRPRYRQRPSRPRLAKNAQ